MQDNDGQTCPCCNPTDEHSSFSSEHVNSERVRDIRNWLIHNCKQDISDFNLEQLETYINKLHIQNFETSTRKTVQDYLRGMGMALNPWPFRRRTARHSQDLALLQDWLTVCSDISRVYLAIRLAKTLEKPESGSGQ